MRHIVVQIGKCNSVFSPNRLSDNNLVYVIEFVPVLVAHIVILNKRLEFRSTGNRHVQRFCREKTFRIKQVEEVLVHQVR